MNSCLWDPQNEYHKNRQINNEAWINIKENLGVACTVKDLKRKKESLMSAYRHYKSKIKKSEIAEAESGLNNVYQPTWFAFSSMDSFLGPIYTFNKSVDNEDQEAIEDTNTNTSETNDFNESTASTSKRSMTPTPVKKRKHPSETRESTFHMKKLKHTKKTSQEQRRPTNLDDECTIFGQLIAKKMRKLADERRDVMMVKINQLFVDEHTIKSPKRSYSDSTSSNSTGTPSPPHIKVEYSPRAHTQTDPLDEENTTVDSVTFVVSNDE